MNLQIDEEKFKKAVAHLKLELSQLSVGRATPALLENIPIEAYQTKSPLSQVASLNIPDPKTIIVQPWDKSILKEVEKSLRQADLDLNISVEGDLLRVTLPPLTEEGRKKLLVIIYQKLEEAKVSVRNAREEMWKDLKNQEKEGQISEDELFAHQKELQKVTDDYNQELTDLVKKKEEEVVNI